MCTPASFRARAESHRSSDERLLQSPHGPSAAIREILAGDVDFAAEMPDNLNTMSSDFAARLARVAKEAALDLRTRSLAKKPIVSRQKPLKNFFRDYIFPGQLIQPLSR